MFGSPVAIAVATLASYVAGSLWYLALGRSWRAAVGWTEDGKPYKPTPFELGVALVGQFVMAVALSNLLGALHFAHLGVDLAVATGIWLGFILPTLATNVVFQRRNLALIWQDGLHWLLILAIQAAVFAVLA